MKLIALAEEITGKKVESRLDNFWAQEDHVIYVPEGDENGLLHEILHWLVASDAERTWPNLALDYDDVSVNEALPEADRLPEIDPVRRERQTCFLEREVYKRSRFPMPASSCGDYPFAVDSEKQWARSRVSDELLQQLADALETGKSNWR